MIASDSPLYLKPVFHGERNGGFYLQSCNKLLVMASAGTSPTGATSPADQSQSMRYFFTISGGSSYPIPGLVGNEIAPFFTGNPAF